MTQSRLRCYSNIVVLVSPLTAQTRNPFSISFYLVALLFLIFDLEIALVYPVAVSLNAVGNYGF
jgi:NADH-ubiquinone oxidoreductase chain 3